VVALSEASPAALLGLVREYVKLSRRDEVRGTDLKRARQMMGVLRRFGFSSEDVSQLSGGRWDSASVRAYTSGWGGEVNSVAKDRVLNALMDLASSNRSVEDVERFINVERSVKFKGSSLERVADIDVNLGVIGGSPEDLHALSGVLRAEGLTVKVVKNLLEVLREIKEKYDVDPTDIRAVKLLCDEQGGYQRVRDSIEANGGLAVMRGEMAELRPQLERTRSGLEGVKRELEEKQRPLLVLSGLEALGWSSPMLMILSGQLIQSDKPATVTRVLQGVRSIEALEEKEKIMRERVERAAGELEKKTGDLQQINAAFSKGGVLESIAEIYKSQEAVRSIIDLYVNPNAVKVNSEKLAAYVYKVLNNYFLRTQLDEDASADLKPINNTMPPLLMSLDAYNIKMIQMEKQRQATADEKPDNKEDKPV
jgi:hypothetical protein